MGDDGCPFCDYAAGRAVPDGGLVFDGASAIAFRPKRPFAPGHTLIIPRLHYVSFMDADAPTTAAVMGVARILSRSKGPDGFNLLTSAGEAATQTVMHWHVHLIPRQDDDELGLWPWAKLTAVETDKPLLPGEQPWCGRCGITLYNHECGSV